MDKKIEPGCRVVLVNFTHPSNNGWLGTVSRGIPEHDGWEVDMVLEDGSVLKDCYFPSTFLQRVDDHNEKSSWEEIKDIWQPPLATPANKAKIE